MIIQETTKDDLLKEYVNFCTTNGLPHECVEFLLDLDLTIEQRAWLVEFEQWWNECS